jgi:hypothetical protein
MNTPEEIKETLVSITSLLKSAEIPFHVTGGLVSIHYGEPRYTRDIDFVVNLKDGAIDKLLDLADGSYYYEPDTVKQTANSGRMFQLIDCNTLFKIDIYVHEAVPGSLSRCIEVELLDGVYAPISSKEDAILSKLIWIKSGSGKSRQDVVSMFLNPVAIDMETLFQKARELNVFDLLEELLTEAEELK